ncbi:hybrid sensor histidine kinase/response regulator [bacterium]|nr:hybrid sensor histidine kinase/response regulator [bacterium]
MITVRTLVVDDEAGMRKSIARVLSKTVLTIPDVDQQINFEVDLAADGSEALAKLKSNQPDLLLLDYKLPDITGLEILDQLTAEESEMVTIMITAYASLETAVAAVKNGAFDFLAKPFNPEELRSTVSKAVQNLIVARQLKKLARERHQVRFQFISVLGHELKSPINAVEGYLNLMKSKTMGDDIESYDSMIDRCLVRTRGMIKLILDLLDLTRLESGSKTQDLCTSDIRDIAIRSIETMQPMADERGIQCVLHADKTIDLYCDSGEIEIIFNNLISNAVKYNKDNGSVDVYLDKVDNLITIKVKDTGIGMNAEEQATLFQEFTRIKNAQTRNITGSGLGLTILKKITALYSGTIKISSQPDQGSTFIVTLIDNIDNEENH